MVVHLTQGKLAVIDKRDAWVTKWKWSYHHTGYAFRNCRVAGKKRMVLMHRLIMNAPADLYVDHRDGDGLNNRRTNLRLCTNSQNQMNRHVVRSASGRKGVTWNKSVQKWQASIKKDRRSYYLGCFSSLDEAEAAYLSAAAEMFGEFANRAA
jgi:hypothetical protein